MNNDTIIKIEKAVPRIDTLQFKNPIDWEIRNGEHWAVIGPNGAGKTLLIDILTGKHALKAGSITFAEGNTLSNVIKSVAFSDIYSLADIKNSYYQQRWNAGDEHDVPQVKELLTKGDKERIRFLTDAFGIHDLIEKPVNLLSSGELRKTLIVRSLLNRPRILVLDNPFIGLDVKSRGILNEVLQRLSEMDRLQIILILSNPGDIPSFITHIQPVYDKNLLPPVSREIFLADQQNADSLFKEKPVADIQNLKENDNENMAFEKALVFKNIHIRYGKRTILRNLDWTVKRGEKWALLGENGSGKSTLLSLVSGDNPQAYANDITLFDRKRGTGESIWDIKKRIGYISPEMHLYYLKNVRCLDVVGSGFFDTIGLYRTCNEQQLEHALKWMNVFDIEHIKDISFLNISTGEQRLVLLARVFVKNPDLLILDEPLHGLDVSNKRRVKKIIEEFCTPEKALIYVTHYEEEIPEVVDKRLTLTKQN